MVKTAERDHCARRNTVCRWEKLNFSLHYYGESVMYNTLDHNHRLCLRHSTTLISTVHYSLAPYRRLLLQANRTSRTPASCGRFITQQQQQNYQEKKRKIREETPMGKYHFQESRCDKKVALAHVIRYSLQTSSLDTSQSGCVARQ